ncbi:3,4-dihydroxy-2-butanone-4-phosphate synthase [Conexibacter stalactiti]|uniref:3,4-dihydroxy-2-butanone-4-phosphate synthase n=1 Tax=Conexibacter stalactiti TaxID=1940611 RepID=A0ABU4HIE1_9ACTN|nr:3,4-dihydroxy-2-butanone-4-phosphate synthase [Conexibacter stalactiti]MDW5593083.1 3,4-dihydroxy-2-butanone-4-phosphate synthase [Conexibacter stalactiti]MEC5033724.1 3,4-dihydroxy-2-butanone-4-phosphate synthase [Conexibacter stalactiti]
MSAHAITREASLERDTSAETAVRHALRDIALGRMVVLVDDLSPEHGSCLVMATEFVTGKHVNAMTREAGGMICLALTSERCEQLELKPMVGRNENARGTAFMATIDAREGVTTGASAADQAHTMLVAIDPSSTRSDIVMAGCVHPLRGRPGGVLERCAHTEASIDLVRLAGCRPAATICGVQNDDGAVAGMLESRAYARRHGLQVVTITDVIALRRLHDRRIQRVVSTAMPTRFGTFSAVGYRSGDGGEHLALVKGQVDGKESVLVHVHRACTTGDVFHARGCTCGERLEAAMRSLEAEGAGVLIYLSSDAPAEALVEQVISELGVASTRVTPTAAPSAGGSCEHLVAGGERERWLDAGSR